LTIDYIGIILYNHRSYEMSAITFNVKSLILAAIVFMTSLHSFGDTLPSALSGTIDTSNGNDNVDFKMKDLHGKWLTSHKKMIGNTINTDECLQSTMDYPKYGKPYFCQNEIKDPTGATEGVYLYLPTDVYFEPNNSYSYIQIKYKIVDGTVVTRTYVIQKVMDYGHDNLVELILPQHVEDFIYYVPTSRRLDIYYNETSNKIMTFSILNPMWDDNGHPTKDLYNFGK